MSRSYKKFPICKQNTKKGKKLASKKVRAYLKRNCDISNGSMYKKIFCSNEIWDYAFYQTKEDVIQEWEKDQIELAYNIRPWRMKFTLQEELSMWYKSYKMK